MMNKKRAFTLVEVLISAAIFMAFLAGVFSLFNMGYKMFFSGSWKYNKQKEGERFLQILKERVEQASIPAKIKKIGDSVKLLKSANTAFFVGENKVYDTKSLTSNQYFAEFLVSKVDKTDISTGTAGLRFYHALYCEPQDNGLAKLVLYANQKADGDNHFQSVAYVNDSNQYKFPPDDLDGAKIDGNASKDYSFPNGVHSYSLNDVSSVEITNGYYDPSIEKITKDMTKSPVFEIKITMEDPKYHKTTLQLLMQARVEKSLKFAVVRF